MDDIDYDDDPIAARRRHNALIDRLDREIDSGDDQPPVEHAPVETPPLHPRHSRTVARYGQDVEDEWSNRMARRYGGEW